ncbi:hypothetical protein AT05_11920 [Schleiferia thermophila str. Yellowstone]|nr:hypothetical protein AT05_11920 [Schleiferia thermophila str. Yellowstone]
MQLNNVAYQETIICTPDRSITLDLVGGYRKKETRYEEGIMVTFTYSDSSYILVFCGRMQLFPLLSGKEYIVNEQVENDYKSRSGINAINKKYWREDNYKFGIAVIYDNVSETRVKEFNNVLDNVKINQ